MFVEVAYEIIQKTTKTVEPTCTSICCNLFFETGNDLIAYMRAVIVQTSNYNFDATLRTKDQKVTAKCPIQSRIDIQKGNMP